MEKQPSFHIYIFDGAELPQKVDLKSFHRPFVSFGRGQDNDIVLKSKYVSKHHGRLHLVEDQIVIEDTNSSNGTFLNGIKVRESIFRSGDILRIDDMQQGKRDGVLIIRDVQDSMLSWQCIDMSKLNAIRIGREKSCEICLPHMGVSKYHAVISRSGNQYQLEDCHSTNGTFLNGHPVRGKVTLGEKDILMITNSKLIFTNGRIYFCSYRSGIGVDALHVVKTVKNQGKTFNICNDVTLSIEPGELVAIIGGSGAGKTTFMNAISGYSQPTGGRVLINGEELYETYDALKNIIGYVPQQDIVYDNLTLFSMLEYAAKLRLPDDTTQQERQARVQQVIDTVELTGKEQTMIRRLSGGQKKRASIAVELLSDPNLFFLDEPASGLDPGTERNLMQTLKNMTYSGKTVILVTHSTLNLQVCDKIIFMGRGGNLCFFGSDREAKQFFQVDNLVDVYNMITEEPEKWRRKYDEMVRRNGEQPSGRNGGDFGGKARNKHSSFRQMGVLSSRYFHLMINDRQRLMMLMLQAPILAFLISLVKDGNQFEYYGTTKSLLFALSCSAFWVGILNAIQEVCKERNILRREYMTGLHLGPYILSKFLILGGMCLVQSFLLSGVFALLVGMPEEGLLFPAYLELFLTTFLTAFSAAAMGIFASSLFKNPDRAMTVAPILLVPQVLFSGLLFGLGGATQIISWFAICRWSMEAYGSSANLNDLTYIVEMNGKETEVVREAEEFFEYTKGHLGKDWLLMLAFVLVFGILSGIVLRNIKKKE